MKKAAFLVLFFAASFLFAENEELSFTEEPLELSEEEVVEDEAFLELLKTAVLPEQRK